MAEIITMPRLSDTMEEGTVAKWLKKVGDNVEEGDILAEIETDKATMEFESFHEGTLLHIGIPEGEGAPVDALLAIIGEEGEDISGLLNGQATADSSSEPKESEDAQAEAANAPSEGGAAEVPEGVEIVTMPRLSDTMEEGTVASWLKNVGDTVEEGDILAEIETDKATMEFESFYSGTLLHIGIQEGESAPVDEVLAVIGPEGTDVSAVLNAGTSKAPAAKKETKQEESPKTEPEKPGVAASSGSAGSDGGRVFVSPLARKMAAEKGIDLRVLFKRHRTGLNDHVVKRNLDIRQFVYSGPGSHGLFHIDFDGQVVVRSRKF